MGTNKRKGLVKSYCCPEGRVTAQINLPGFLREKLYFIILANYAMSVIL